MQTTTIIDQSSQEKCRGYLERQAQGSRPQIKGKRSLSSGNNNNSNGCCCHWTDNRRTNRRFSGCSTGNDSTKRCRRSTDNYTNECCCCCFECCNTGAAAFDAVVVVVAWLIIGRQEILGGLYEIDVVPSTILEIESVSLLVLIEDAQIPKISLWMERNERHRRKWAWNSNDNRSHSGIILHYTSSQDKYEQGFSLGITLNPSSIV